MKHLFTLAVFAGVLVASQPLWSQDGAGGFGGGRGGRGGGGDRGGDRGGRGGSMFGGGPPGGFGGGGPGGPPGGFGGGFGGPPGGFGGPPGGVGGGGFGGPPGGFGGGGFGGPPGGGSPWGGGGGGDRSSRFGSMMDSNGNGKVDQEELDRMPSFVRDMMKARGVELKAGMSLDDMRNSMSRGFAGGPGGNPGDPNANPNGQQQRPKTLTPYRMKPKKPVTLALPPAYAEVDADYDGQLGMHEWMMTRRAEIEQFEAMDVDFDGFLTPEELQAAEAAAAAGQAVASTDARQRLTIVSATPAKARNAGQNPTGAPNAPPGPGQPQANGSPWGGNGGNGGGEAAMAPAYFQRLDQNGNGMIEANEWQQSRRVRGMFEQAGIKLDNMNMEQFTQNLTRVTASQQGQPQGR